MKKILLASSAIALSAVLAFSALTGCGNKENNNNNTGESSYYTFGEYTGGLHEYSANEVSGEYILKDGSVNYTVVLPAESDARTALAKTDFTNLFLEATGREIQTITDAGATYDQNSRYIVIGSKKLEEQAGLTLSDEINVNGFQIKTKDKSIFIMAQDSAGALFGAYELLTRLFGYERFTVNYYDIEKNVTEVPLYNFDISDNPDYEMRIGTFGAVYTDITNASRMRFLLQYQDIYIAEDYPAFHNTLDYINPKVYLDADNPDNATHKAHPGWFAQSVGGLTDADIAQIRQLCYTAHGDTEEYNLLVQTMTDAVTSQLEKDLEKDIITITQEDNRMYCNCDACAATQAKYGGALSAAMWLFHNEVCRGVQAWIDEHQPGRRVLVAMFAYQAYQLAPVTENNGVYTPIDEKMIGEPNAAVFLAPSTSDYFHPFNSDMKNVAMESLHGWKACTSNVGLWMYQTSYNLAGAYFLPYDNFSSMQENYKEYAEAGAKWIFDQGQQGNNNGTAFNNFKLYLNSKWQWNVNLDFFEMRDAYFDYMYGPASEIMKTYFMDMRMHIQNNFGGVSDIDDGTFDNINKWPYATAKRWYDYCQEAFDTIEGVKTTDPELYSFYYDNILTETITPRWIIIYYYSASLNESDLINWKSEFKADCYRLNFTEPQQHVDITEYLKDW